MYLVGHLRDRGRREVFSFTEDDGQTASLQTEYFNTLIARYGAASGVGSYIAEGKQDRVKIIVSGELMGSSYEKERRVYSPDGLAPSISARDYKRAKKIAVKSASSQGTDEVVGVLDDKGHKKDYYKMHDTVPALCAQTHGNPPKAVLSDYRIRKLTPRECFRLQGFPDELFDKAQAVNSDSQLYKQAGNAVTVNVAYVVGECIRRAEQ